LKMRSRTGFSTAAALLLSLAAGRSARAETPATTRASGPFEVKITPKPSEDKADAFGRMTVAKQLHGALEGTSRGEMLTAMSAVEGSGVYVAIERVEASLEGRKGTFVLHHTGVMTRGTPHLTIAVVPDSGTGDLVGISGRMAIRIEEGGKHFYDFDYSLPPAAPAK